MTAKTAADRLRYAKLYGSVLGARTGTLLQLPPNKRIHIMKAISCLAQFTGQTERWRSLRQQHGLTWSTGTEKIDAFNRFFDSSKDLDTLLQWLASARRVLPVKYGNLLLFCTLTGMRGSEAVESVRLLVQSAGQYYDPERQILQHYLFPNLFIRRTKAIYISIVNDDIVSLANKLENTPP